MLYPFVRPLNTLIISEPLLVDFSIVMLERNKKSYVKGNKYILDVLLCSITKYFYELSHIGQVKIQTTSTNSQRYYTTTRLITKRFIIQHAKFLSVWANFADIYSWECVTEACKAEQLHTYIQTYIQFIEAPFPGLFSHNILTKTN